MSTPAPAPNCGFTTTGPAGWVRLWLLNDDPNGSPSDLWTVPGRSYPLAVAAYLLDETVEHPNSLVFNESTNLGGYTRSRGLDETPTEKLDDNVGLFACSSGTFDLTTTESVTSLALTLTAGDFYAGNVTSIDSQSPYLFLVRV